MSGQRFYEFGPFRLDVGRRLLFREGEVVPLTPKVLHTLLVLVENRERVVGKEELMKAIWSDTFVEEGNLTQNISTLRRALGETPGDHAYIETVPKQGYRFVAIVTETAPPPPLKKRAVRAWSAAIAAAVLLTAALAWWLRHPEESPSVSLTVIPLTSYPGLELHPSFSPDGSQVAFTWDGERRDNLDIYVKLAGSERTLRMTSHPTRDYRPAWSPDGQWIAFLREVGGGNAVVAVVPAIGGQERRVAAVYPGPFGSYAHAPCLEWSPDGRWLLTADRAAPDQPSSLILISVATGEKRRLTSPPQQHLGDLTGAFSPDGRTLAFSRSPFRHHRRGVHHAAFGRSQCGRGPALLRCQ
jgi:DNA-binding winged helix-turn-helix (wHTH) protein/WD40 repeat protein